MRHRSALLIALLLTGTASTVPAVRSQENAPAPTAAPEELKPIFGRAVKAGLSRPARSIASPVATRSRLEAGEEEREIHNPPLPRGEDSALAALFGLPPEPYVIDPVAQTFAPAPLLPGPSLTFDGLANSDNTAAFGFRVLPPDTNGDVGPNHYVQTVNLLFRVYNKSGTPLTPPLKMSSLFASIGGVCAARDDGDPIALYDEAADRWLLSQFAFPNFPNPPFHQCIAVSQTADPAGAYFVYDFVMPNTKLNDYPHFGVWPDAYYMTDNQFQAPALNFAGAGAFAFDRARMLAGDPGAGFIYFDLFFLDPGLGGGLPTDLDGAAPPSGTPNYFAFFTSLVFGDPLDGMRLFEFHADFANPAASTFTERAESPVPVAAFDPSHNSRNGACAGSAVGFNSADDIDQPPIPGLPAASCNAKLDVIADRLMHRLQYRNFGAHESLVASHTVDVNFSPPLANTGHKAGIRYYELRRPLPGGAFAVKEQASFAPDGDHRWMASAAMDSNGNLAVGYSTSSTATFPSLRFAGRTAGSPPGGLFLGEASLHAGAGSQANTASRWGDYSSLSVDPTDGCTFWYTTEYYRPTNPALPGTIPCGVGPGGVVANSNACWSTRIGRFRFPTCISGASASPNVLWPPNHKFRLVTVSYAADTTSCSLSVASNEPGVGADAIVLDAHRVQLRAERLGGGDGRIYTITITCADGAGNSSSVPVTVRVPHDQGH